MAKPFKTPNPFDYFANTMQVGYLMAESQAVVAMRTLGIFGIWSVTPAEHGRMISEKVYAMTKASTNATKVAVQGGSPDEVAAAAIKPIRQKSRANAKRLGKRGLKKA